MKWYHPVQSAKELDNQIKVLATLAIAGLLLGIVAIFMTMGENAKVVA